MINDRIIEIEEAINKLTVDLLVPIRTSKTVNEEAFDQYIMNNIPASLLFINFSPFTSSFNISYATKTSDLFTTI